MIALVVIALSFGVSVLIRFALSRSREYLADAGSVELTKNPDAMISALRKISANATIPAMPSRMQAFFIESPALLPESGWLATHPPIEERIAALVEFAGGRDQPAPRAHRAAAADPSCRRASGQTRRRRRVRGGDGSPRSRLTFRIAAARSRTARLTLPLW